MGCHFLLQGISPIQGSNLHLLHWQVNSLSLRYLGSPKLPYDSAVLLLGIADPLVGGFCVCKSTYWQRLICNPHISTCGRVGVIDRRRQWHPTPVLLVENPMDGEAWQAVVHGVARVGHDWATSLSLFTFMHWRRKWQPTPVFLPGESQGWGSLMGCCLWGCTESDTTEAT